MSERAANGLAADERAAGKRAAEQGGARAGAGAPSLAGVVLAAGAGTRLRPLTDVVTKALCPVNGVPLVDRALARLEPHVEELAVNAHHRPEALIAHVEGRAHVSWERPRPLGTAGALGLLRPWIDGRGALVTNADAYFAGDLDALVRDWDGERVRLLVHPSSAKPFFADAGYSGSCLLPWSLVATLEPVPTGLYEVAWRRLWEAGQLELVSSGAPFIDCGTPADYLRANLHASGGASVVGAGAQVQGELVRSVVWAGERVERGERLVESIRGGGHTVAATLTD